ncbi:hypothetical protein E5343_07115 [Rodentibacter caecimuris]|uniref:hypothetical protein n=1 Tax=Rodentibacter caecimuris TaxID=1796644 RepID=UPI0010946721|nr:hypothetical protein [Pasteurella caecimuris]TGY49359.1 hypothetical protein E5343_07115 [Pasteurella caecimuris]
MKNKKLFILWLIIIVFLLIRLFININSTDVELYVFEAYILYIGILFLLSFPLGSVFIIIVMLIGSWLFPNIPNNLSVIIITTSSSLGFYIQWYKIFPKLKEKILKNFFK